MHILIAPNAFKNSLTAEEVALAIKKGFMQSKLKSSYECFPIGDGGDGTAELIIKKCDGNWWLRKYMIRLEKESPVRLV